MSDPHWCERSQRSFRVLRLAAQRGEFARDEVEEAIALYSAFASSTVASSTPWPGASDAAPLVGGLMSWSACQSRRGGQFWRETSTAMSGGHAPPPALWKHEFESPGRPDELVANLCFRGVGRQRWHHRYFSRASPRVQNRMSGTRRAERADLSLRFAPGSHLVVAPGVCRRFDPPSCVARRPLGLTLRADRRRGPPELHARPSQCPGPPPPALPPAPQMHPKLARRPSPFRGSTMTTTTCEHGVRYPTPVFLISEVGPSRHFCLFMRSCRGVASSGQNTFRSQRVASPDARDSPHGEGSSLRHGRPWGRGLHRDVRMCGCLGNMGPKSARRVRNGRGARDDQPEPEARTLI